MNYKCLVLGQTEAWGGGRNRSQGHKDYNLFSLYQNNCSVPLPSPPPGRRPDDNQQLINNQQTTDNDVVI